MGRLAVERGQYAAALGYYQQSLELRRAIGHLERVPEVLYALALALQQTGDNQRALSAINTSITTLQDLNAVQGQVMLERAQQLQQELHLRLGQKS